MYAALAIMLAQPAFQGTLMIMLLQGAKTGFFARLWATHSNSCVFGVLCSPGSLVQAI
jgi:hypothetical protein